MKENIVVSCLSNGIRVITQERETEAVAFCFFVGCGSRNEKDEIVGVSHALEHSMFKGTSLRTAHDIARETEGKGAEINAFTSEECTCYWFAAPADTFREVAEVYADSLHNSLLDEKEWSTEQKNILEERLMYEESNTLCVQSILLPEAMFNLQMSVIGSIKTIKRIKPIHMRELIKEWYLPENIIISVAGGIKHKVILEICEELFGNFHKSWDVNPKLPTLNPLPAQSPEPYVEKIRKEKQFGIAMGFRAYSKTDERSHAASLLNLILGGGMSSRLFQEVREKRGFAYSVYSSREGFKDTGTFSITAFTSNPLEALPVIIKELGKIRKSPVSDREIRDAKIARKAFSKKEEGSVSFALRNASSIFYHGRIIGRDEGYKKIEGVSKKDILAVARDIFVPDNITIALTGPRSWYPEIQEEIHFNFKKWL